MRTIASLLMVLLGACSAAYPDAAGTMEPGPADRDRSAIEASFGRWIDAYEQADPDLLASLFTEDGVYAANTGELLQGREGIRAGVAAWFQGSSQVGRQRAAARLDLQRRSIRFRRQGSLAHDLARFVITMDPPGCTIDAGHALSVWERQADGRWLIDALVVNQDRTPPESACRR